MALTKKSNMNKMTLGGGYKLLTSIILAVFAVALTLGLIFVNKGNNKPSTPVEVEEEMSPTKGVLVGGIYYASAAEETGASDAPKTSKGAIYVGDGAEVTIDTGLISGHEALYGGAIYVENGGHLYINGGTISNNTSRLGGAIYVEAGGTVEFTGGTITGNYAEPITGSIGGDGTAAVYAEYGATVTTPENCSITNNISQNYGNYIIYNVDGVEKWVGIGFEEDPVFDAENLTNAPLDYTHCPGYFTDTTFTTEVTTNVEFEQDGTYSPASSSKIFKKYASGLYTKTATKDKLTFTLSNGTNSVTKNGTPTGEVVIPRQYSGKNVTSIGNNAFQFCSGLTSVTIPDSVTSIGNYAFQFCSGLTSVTLPFGLKTIGASAFNACQRLTQISIPDSVTSIGDTAFFTCTGLTSVTIGGSVTSIGEGAFYYCNGLTSVVIPDSVTSIGNGAFQFCSGLTSVVIPDSVTSIGSGAFKGCDSLFNLTIPFVGGSLNAQAGPSSLFGYIFGTTSYGSGTTQIYNASVEIVDYQPVITPLGYETFAIPTSLRKVNVTGGVMLFSAFSNCSMLTEINIQGTVPSEYFTPWSAGSIGTVNSQLGLGTFFGCTNLKKLTLCEGITGIEFGTCYGCSSLETVVLPSTLTNIGYAAFNNCVNLDNVTIPANVTEIGDYAFYNNNLNTFTFANGSHLATIGQGAFQDTNITSVTIPSGVTSIGSGAFAACSGLTQFIVDENNTAYASQDGILYNKAKTEIVAVPQGITGSITLSDSVTSIGNYAFSGCRELTSVTIPASVTSIGSWAFGADVVDETDEDYGNYIAAGALITYGDDGLNRAALTKLTTVTFASGSQLTSLPDYMFHMQMALTTVNNIPNTVESLGRETFGWCSHLANITLPTNLKTIGPACFQYCAFTIVILPFGLETIGANAFHACQRLMQISIPNSVNSIGEWAFHGCSDLTSISIPSSVTSIGGYAFWNCSGLTSVVIPDSVTTINEGAFSGCSGLTSVTIDSSTIAGLSSSGSYLLTNATTVYVKDTITSVGTYITNSFTQTTSDKAGYNKYVKNS